MTRKCGADHLGYCPREGERQMQIYEHSIHLMDVNGEIFAEFMVMRDYDTPSQKWIKCIPFFGMFSLNKIEPNNPIVRQNGETMQPEGFLGYIANVIRFTSDKIYPHAYFTMRTVGSTKDHSYVTINLINGIKASEIAKLTGFDPEMVRAFYEQYFVVSASE